MFDWHLRVLEVYLKANRPSRTSLLHGLTLIHCRQHITGGTTLQEFLMQYEKNDQRGRRCEIDTGFCLRQLKTERFFAKSPSKALVVPVLWFSTWCFCQQILKQCLIRTENFICFGHFFAHCLRQSTASAWFACSCLHQDCFPCFVLQVLLVNSKQLHAIHSEQVLENDQKDFVLPIITMWG